MITYQRKAGTTDVSVIVRIIDATDGTPETGVVYNTSGIDLQYRREGATSTAITEATLAGLDSAHADGGFLHIGNGYYRLDLPDAACAAGAAGVLVHGTVTGMVVIGCYLQLVAVDPFDAVRMGLTALPNAAADAAGGLPISDAGGLDLDAIKSDTAAILVDTGTTLDGRIPAALVSGRMDASVGAMAAGVVTAAAVATGAIDADALATDAVAEIADGVWDEAASGHVTAGTFGQRLQILRAATAQAGAASTITLDASASAVDDFYNDTLLQVVGGTGVGQSRIISDYVGSTKVATVAAAWATNPANDSVFLILPSGSSPATITGTVDANVVQWNSSNVATPTTAGVPEVDLTYIAGSAVSTTTAQLGVNTVQAGGTAWGSGAITAASIAADAITDAKVASDVTIASVTGAVGSVTGNVGGNVVGSVGSVTGAVGSVTGNVGGSVASIAAGGITAASIATGAIDADALAADAVDEILDEVIEGTVTMRQALRVFLSALAGKVSGAGTTSITFRDTTDATNRIAATVDSSGNRTAVTLTLT